MAQPGAPAIQLVDNKGNFDMPALESFVKSVRLSECGLSYAVVAIMGPQSSGKSTLLNHLFHTKFAEMDAYKGRNQTTKGIWLQRGEGLDPCTLVMDLEGTDGRERGEDDTAFEKQSALFALAVADIVLINMWCHDIGREQASNKPLLKTVFQVMMRLFTPRKTTLMVVIRDKTRAPLEILEPILREDIQKIWDSVPKPEKFRETPLSECFNLEVTALSNYEDKEDQFKQEVAELRKRFNNSVAPGGLAGDRRAVVPGTGFPLSTQQIWEIIKENKDLDLPAHKVMVATVRCEEIAHETLRDLTADEKWRKLEESAKGGTATNFGKKASALLEKHLSEYDEEAAFFEEGVRETKRNNLLTEALEVVRPSYESVLGHHRVKALDKFKHDLETAANSPPPNQGFGALVRQCSEMAMTEFDHNVADASVTQTEWDSSKTREKLLRDINMHAQAVRAAKLGELTAVFEKKVEAAIAEPVASLLDAASPHTWPSIRNLLERDVQAVTSSLSDAMAGFELTEEEEADTLSALSVFARSIVVKKSKEEASQVLIRMKDRFNNVFGHEPDSLPRVWGKEHDVRTITRDARIAALKLLSVLAALRLEPQTSEHDDIESALMSLLGDSQDTSKSASATKTSTSDNKGAAAAGSNALVASSWPGDPRDTLLTPGQCRTIWRQFKAETEYTISQALSAQEASKHGDSWLPPLWTIVAMTFLGFNELMALLRNPLYIAVLFVAYLVGKAVWVQLDIAHEFRLGFLPGILSISSKLLPTMMNSLQGLVNAGEQKGNNGTMAERVSLKMQDFASDDSDSVEGNLRQRQQVKMG